MSHLCSSTDNIIFFGGGSYLPQSLVDAIYFFGYSLHRETSDNLLT